MAVHAARGALLGALLACSTRQEAPAPDPVSASAPARRPDPAAPASVPTSAPAVPLRTRDSLSAWVGRSIQLQGTPARIPHQHLIERIPGKAIEYLDLEDGAQLVVYAKDVPPCPGEVLVEGVLLRVEGAGKAAGSGRVVELQLDASAWRCVLASH